MQRFELLEKHRQEFEERMENERRKFDERLSTRAEDVQLQLASRNQELQAQRDIEQGRIAKWGMRITIVGAVIAFLQVFTLTQDSLLWKVLVRLYQWLFG
jgi:type VI protein secretion system component VasF